jgi:hypothetical protein
MRFLTCFLARAIAFLLLYLLRHIWLREPGDAGDTDDGAESSQPPTAANSQQETEVPAGQNTPAWHAAKTSPARRYSVQCAQCGVISNAPHYQLKRTKD